jgi:hypothetical protein
MIIKFTPTPTPEHVDMAWMQMQSLLDKHLPVPQKRKKYTFLYFSKIAAVFMLLLQVPVAFQMGSINLSRIPVSGELSAAVKTAHKVKVYHYNEKVPDITHSHLKIQVEKDQHLINTNFSLPPVALNFNKDEIKSGNTDLIVESIKEENKVLINLPAENPRSSGLKVQFAVKPNLPLHIQDMVSGDKQRVRAAQYLDIPLNVTVPVSPKVNLHAGVQVSYLQSLQTRDVYAVNNSASMPSVSTLVVPVARTVIPSNNLSQDVSVKNINRGINAGMSYKTGPGELGVLYQYGTGQIYGMQGSNQNRHTVSISFKCPIK